MTISETQEKEICRLVGRAGAELMRSWPGMRGQGSAALDIQKKSDGSVVTKADLASNAVIMTGLKTLFPADSIISEESQAAPSHGSRVWIVDPLDSTQSYVEGNANFSILLGLSIDQLVHFGVIHYPVSATWAVAQHGKGATENGAVLKVSASKKIREGGVNVRHYSLDDKKLQQPGWMDSGRALLSLCRGELDGMIIKINRHGEWDLAAYTIMVQESGGKVTDENGNEIRFAQPKLSCKYFVASNSLVHDDLLNVLKN